MPPTSPASGIAPPPTVPSSSPTAGSAAGPPAGLSASTLSLSSSPAELVAAATLWLASSDFGSGLPPSPSFRAFHTDGRILKPDQSWVSHDEQQLTKAYSSLLYCERHVIVIVVETVIVISNVSTSTDVGGLRPQSSGNVMTRNSPTLRLLLPAASRA